MKLLLLGSRAGLHSKEVALDKLYQSLNPVKLRRDIDRTLEKLWAVAEPEGRRDKIAKPREEVVDA